MAVAYFIAVLAVEHDGILTGSEMCEVIGQALDDWELEVTGTTEEEGLVGSLSITECIGVDECLPSVVEELLEARNKRHGNEQPPLEPSA